ncbi:Hypothetical protein, putative [Bodo saltans]|uniref:RPGR-interacting protein 1 first C2 domain-containing protein n=1 Tax=Bodo saltans TaxID=75058 RepID=A0A0S4IT50_BODSA|nr:Hypothetical protein, putative [Bodo saltans]|eukprot:CUG06414.1 Hypothetical protein, putative [Bodo saltans]
MSHNIGRKTGKDWEESYLNLEQRYLALQKDVQRKEKEAQLAAVQERKRRPGASAKETNSSVIHTPVERTPLLPHGSPNIQPPSPSFTQRNDLRPSPPRPASASKAMSKPRPTSSSSRPGTGRMSASPKPLEVEPAPLPQPHHEVLPPDPRLVWGAEKTVEHFVQVNQLYQATEQLRHKLEEAENVTKVQEHEIHTLRQTVSSTQARVDGVTLELHQAVRERDLCAQRLHVADHSTRQAEEAIKTQVAEKERLRSVLEGQIQDLRTRLLVSTDGNDGLSRDVRGLLSELKEKATLVAGLQSRLSLTETSLTSQENTNRSLLVEMKNLNDQLTGERKRTLNIMREAQVGNMNKDRVTELEREIGALVQQRTAMEREHLGMLEDFVRISSDATTRAQDDVRDELHHFKASATHWERVAALMYQDIADRTRSHLAVREECEEAKRGRDEAALATKALRDELRLCNAKLNIVWPTHRTDTAEMDPEKLTKTFSKLGLMSTGRAGSARGDLHQKLYDDLGLDAPTQEDYITELEQANAALEAELEAQRVSNELLSERLRNQHEVLDEERRDHSRVFHELEDQIDIGQTLLDKREQRVDFLEQQVRRLRGEAVNPNVSLEVIGASENVFELFIGQMLRVDGAGESLQSEFPTLFCTVDFLVHETTATKTIRGWSGFLDTTMAFCVSMDALLWHYLSTRGVMIQLHQVIEEDSSYRTVAEGYASVWELVERRLEDHRPCIRDAMRLFDVQHGRHVASIEFSLTARVPFSQHFKSFAKTADFQKVLMQGAAQHNQSRRWKRAAHQGDHHVSVHNANLNASLLQSQASIGPSVSVPKVLLTHHSAAAGRDALEPISALCIWVDEVKLLYNLDHLPLLSCYYTLSALEKDVWIQPAAVPSHIWAIESIHSFPISSMREVFRLLRDPLALYFFDESTRSVDRYWATSTTELAPALTAVGDVVSVVLPLISYTGMNVGTVTARIQAKPLHQQMNDYGAAPPQAFSATQAAASPQRTLNEELFDQHFGPAVVAHPAPLHIR